jgi:hypothetical protein
LGAFARLYAALRAQHGSWTNTDCVLTALKQVHGVDLNPFAVEITRFRLMLAATLADTAGEIVPFERIRAFAPKVGVADALLGSTEAGQRGLGAAFTWQPRAYLGETREGHALLETEYTVVVGNPPYITPKDAILRERYRKLYSACKGKYSLVVPFVQRFFELAVHGDTSSQGQLGLGGVGQISRDKAGWVGMIVANSFAKREFGSELVETYFPTVDLTHVVDTSGAYIPGHGTPTVILFGRSRAPATKTVRAVLGTRGEPSTPADPTQGVVWRSIADHTNDPGFENDFVTVANLDRTLMHGHPWTLRGGGALEALGVVQAVAVTELSAITGAMGVLAVTGTDDVFVLGQMDVERRLRFPDAACTGFCVGDGVRDYSLRPDVAISPHPAAKASPEVVRFAWPFRTELDGYIYFGKKKPERGMHWLDYGIVMWDRLRPPLTITFAFVATHNHFVLDRGGKVFNRTAPIIKLPESATEDDHLRLIGALNSSVGCFWMQQVFFNKGGPGGGSSKDEKWNDFYEHDSTKLKRFPLPGDLDLLIPRLLDADAQKLAALEPAVRVLAPDFDPAELDADASAWAAGRQRMIALQEELDWRYYAAYGLWPENAGALPVASDEQLQAGALPPVALGERAFEIVLARKMAAGEVTTAWFSRHGSTPRTDVPTHWPEWYRALVQRRIDAIERHRMIRLIEAPEFKRRFNDTPWRERERDALRQWMLRWLEGPRLWPHARRDGVDEFEPGRFTSVRTAARIAQHDAAFAAVAARYEGAPLVDVRPLVATLVRDSAVPSLPGLRFKASGLRVYREWERVWTAQRAEDAIDALPNLTPEQRAERKRREVGSITPAPKYKGTDFAGPGGVYYSLRGPLDVPRERFVVTPGIELEDDGGLTFGWAGWNAAQRTGAWVDLFNTQRERNASPAVLKLLLAHVLHELPWVAQWHGTPDEFGDTAASQYDAWLMQQCDSLGVTRAELETLRLSVPPARS